MKNTALVIMAAGIGSRFGGGIKQLEPVGPNGDLRNIQSSEAAPLPCLPDASVPPQRYNSHIPSQN